MPVLRTLYLHMLENYYHILILLEHCLKCIYLQCVDICIVHATLSPRVVQCTACLHVLVLPVVELVTEPQVAIPRRGSA